VSITRVALIEVSIFCADMDMTLSKLDIGPRSALILIGSGNLKDTPPHSRASATNATDSRSQSESTAPGGSYVGRFLSFLTPYVYGSPAASSRDQTSSESASQNGKLLEIFLLNLCCCMSGFYLTFRGWRNLLLAKKLTASAQMTKSGHSVPVKRRNHTLHFWSKEMCFKSYYN